jgi:hypothetical protein
MLRYCKGVRENWLGLKRVGNKLVLEKEVGNKWERKEEKEGKW